MSQVWKQKTPSWATVPTKFTREEAKTWRDWNNNDKGGDPNYGRFTCSGSTSWGARIDDIDEMFERMVKRGLVAVSKPKRSKALARGRGRK